MGIAVSGIQEFQLTNLWRSTLAQRPDDTYASGRDKLRTAFLSMRERVKPLAAQVHHDCAGLTVHDVTHLDALWETADRITGASFDLNPVEAFVFGGAVLIHDAAMAIAAYEGGLSALRNSNEWRDAVVPELRKRGAEISDETINSPPNEILSSAIFSVLRSLHASQAERLMSRSWVDPSNGNEIYLLEDSSLREYYGPRIGKIAHSHHWHVEKLISEFSTAVAPPVGLPANWVLNETKVACMLRCADAAHIDARRAPRMLYAIKSPQGASDEHWRFQTKIGQAIVRRGKLLFSSSAFDQSEAGAWWLAFDIANMINDELRDSQSLLKEVGASEFEVDGVEGVQSPRLFAKQLPVAGWEPISAEVRVSDPVHLALTLGGKNLYGQGFRAPIRELVQNAADAIRARRGDRSPREFPGHIRITIEKTSGAGGLDEVWLHVDDNGIGMTQRVMTGPLIDFGTSIWSSALLRQEYPSVTSGINRPIGKFGIGFFPFFFWEGRLRSRAHGTMRARTKPELWSFHP
jgi:hypothetical protein